MCLNNDRRKKSTVITIIFTFLVLGALVGALAFSVYVRKRRHQLSDSQKRHLWFATFCGFMGLVVPCGIFIQALFSGDSSMSAPEAVYEYARIKGDFSAAQMSTISAGVRYAHEHYWGSSGRELAYLLYPLSFILLAVLHWQFAFEGLSPEKKADPVGTDNDRAGPGRV